jgi:hypothetical protein
MRYRGISVIFAAGLLMISPFFAGAQDFQKEDFYITPQLGINSYTIPFGVNAEYAITENIGVGGTGMIWLWSSEYWSNSLIALSGDAAYHFTSLDVDKLDAYAGAALGFTIYSWKVKGGFSGDFKGSGSSGLYLQPFLGARYYITETIAVNLRLNVAVLGDWSGIGGFIGVSIPINLK